MSSLILLLIYCQTKQTAHLYYWSRVTTVFLDEFNGMFFHVIAWFYVLKF